MVGEKPDVIDLFKEVGLALKKEGYTKAYSLKLSDEIKNEDVIKTRFSNKK